MNLVTLRLSSVHLLVFCSLAVGACKVDESGLATQTKLQRDGSAPAPDVGGAAGRTGAAGQTEPSGVAGTGSGVAGTMTGNGGIAGDASASGGAGAGSGGMAGETASAGGTTG
ncbi:MAG: hypothetical protein JWM82_3251, partial [Myxococcales bacterium]|nr:hypothetical protein [Myxococcales bacterium]